MANVTCMLARELAEFLDGALSPERETAFRDHLDTCPHCRAAAGIHLGMMAGLAELAETEQGEAAGDHLSDQFLAQLARGECDFASIEAENLHLLRCVECSRRLREIEQSVEEEIRASADVEYNYPAIDYYRDRAKMAAKGQEIGDDLDAQEHDSAINLISCRRFQMEIYCRNNGVYAAIFADDPEMIGPLSVRTADGEPDGAARTDQGELLDDRRTYYLGDILTLDGEAAEVSFEFEEEQWRRRIRFGSATAGH